jgi:hypothetical protein
VSISNHTHIDKVLDDETNDDSVGMSRSLRKRARNVNYNEDSLGVPAQSQKKPRS